MRISLNWLRRYVQFKISPEELAQKLTSVGLEVEGIDQLGRAFKNFVVGEILSVRKHPNADRLSVCDVKVGRNPVSASNSVRCSECSCRTKSCCRTNWSNRSEESTRSGRATIHTLKSKGSGRGIERNDMFGIRAGARKMRRASSFLIPLQKPECRWRIT